MTNILKVIRFSHCWLNRMGRKRYTAIRELMITADCGGSNGARVKLWKVELQRLADEENLIIHVHHYPPGTSKWNKIEHRLFCHIDLPPKNQANVNENLFF